MQDGCVTGIARDLLVSEFSDWKEKNKTCLALVSDSVCDDGRVCLKLSLGSDKIFSLFCPAEYPHYEDNFFAESESVNHLWLNALNEYILDSDGRLTLGSILWKAKLLDSSVRESPSNSSDDEDENEEFMVLEEEDEEDLMERALWDKEKQWRSKEAKLRALLKAGEEAACHSTSSNLNVDSNRKPTQVFSNSAASGILTNDLKHIIKTANETGINVEPIDDNIYDWSVRFSKFDPTSKLQQDLDRLKKIHGIDYIELQLEFTMDLYPFYPPVARMVRPRPEGSVRFMLACLDILKLSSWNPARGMIGVLEEIKAYLAKHAVLHVETAFRSSILLPIENSLLQLALVSEVLPRDSSRNNTSASSSVPRPSTPPCSASSSSTSSTCSSPFLSSQKSLVSEYIDIAFSLPPFAGSHSSADFYMKKGNGVSFATKGKKYKFPGGTGYSTYTDKGWDINAHIAVEKEKDKRIEAVLQKILCDLQECLQHKDCNSNILNSRGSWMTNKCDPDIEESRETTEESSTAKEGGDPKAELSSSHSLSRSNSGSDLSAAALYPVCTSGPWDPFALFEALEASTLIPFIEQKLQVDSFLEICQHKAVYRCVIDILSEIAARPWLARLLWKQPGQKKSIFTLLLILKEKAQKVLDRYKMAAESSRLKKSCVKKGKKRAISGSRDKDKTSRRSKVTQPSVSAPSSSSTSSDGSGNAHAVTASSGSSFKAPAKVHTSGCLKSIGASLLVGSATVSNQDGSPKIVDINPVPSTSSKSHAESDHKISTKGATAAAFCKLMQFTSDLKKTSDVKKTTDATESDSSVKDTEASTSVSSGISGLMSTFGISWPALWNVLNNHEPPPLDISTPLDPAGDEQLAQDFFDLAVKVEHVVTEFGFPGSESPERSDEPLELRRVSAVTGTSDIHDHELATKYIAALKEMQFDACDINVSSTTSHRYAFDFKSAIVPGRAQLMRIAQELSSLSSSLPLDLASAIFVRSDDAKITLLKALIIGPEGTPYASGCFLFDIFLPSNYPKSPPKVSIRTTGGGHVRFNPNLYASGTVCLSLLGTWNGLQGEQWNETSTLLQVLVSIQSLIMVSEPYFNEPGFDSLMGTSAGKSASDSYNHTVKLQTIRLAMVETLKYPPGDFEEVVRTHFRIKKQRILQDIEDYMKMYPNQGAIAEEYKSLKKELAKLKD